MTLPMAPMVSPEQPEPSGQQATALGSQSPTTLQVDSNPLRPPMPAIDKVRGTVYPGPDASSGQKLAYIKKCLQDTDAEHLARAKALALGLLQSNGKQHISWSKASRRYEETPLLENETRVTLNFIRPILRARTNRLLPKNFDWQVIPDSNDYDARDQAKVAERFLGAMRQRTALVRTVDAALELAYCGGVAFIKSLWNPTIGAARPAQLAFVEQVEAPVIDQETGQPYLDENNQPILELQPQQVMRYVNVDGQPVETAEEAYWFRPGDTDHSLRTLFTVRWNPDAQGFAPSEGLRWVIDHEAVPLAVAKERYAEYADKITVSQEANSALTYQRMGALAPLKSTDRIPVTQSGAPDEWTVVTEYWELPNEYHKNGRLIVFVGECEVGDGEFPDGVFPFEAIYDEPTPLSPAGRGVVSDLIAPQRIINDVFAGQVAQSNLQGLGQWIGPNVPGMPKLISNQLGQIVLVPNKALRGRRIQDVIMPLQHAPIASDKMLLFQTAQQAMYDIGAYHEITRGQVPPGVDSGVAVRALSEREDGQLSRSKEALQQAMISIARTQLKIAKKNYAPGDERWIPVDRPDLGYQVESVDGAKLPDPERLSITISGFSPRTAEELRADVKEGMMNGWITPAQGLKALDLGRGVESAYVSEQRHTAKARIENLWIERGLVTQRPLLDVNGQPIPDIDTGEPEMQLIGPDGMPLLLNGLDDAAVHMSILLELILDVTKPREVREAAMAHYQEHQQELLATPPRAPTPESSLGTSGDPAVPPPQA
jgi:hypothetical protein